MESLLIIGIVLLAAALLLILAEVFIPSGGLISLIAAAIGIAGIVCLFRVDAKWGAAGTLAAIVLAPSVFFFGLRVLPSTGIGRKMLFGESGRHDPVLKDSAGEFDALLGMEGDALTDLRPVGAIRIGGKRVDALSEVSFIRAGTRIRVTAVEGAQVKVRPVA